MSGLNPVSRKSYTIAPGRSVTGDDFRDLAAGDLIELDATEGERLTKLGFLVPEGGAVLITDNGPPVDLDMGVPVKSNDPA